MRLKEKHEAECLLISAQFLQSSSDNFEDEAMEESEEEPAQEFNPLVTSPVVRPEDSDSETCSAHPSQFEEANSSIAEDAWTLTARFALTTVSISDDTLSAQFIY